ncbi:hypothetical protein N7516_007347 [Penicillium verrucosum]|uniref:uncharacterized protein n=1 Tax=Penicillium verrucosum TaxID=60171 RepID=UPI00254547C6|nr:uncharacterized protein N7516_007347 [Penicillium verrucosum]KAJ5932858.1 hypothetical protein N7516_007347 [Penicillium verrucosum]
MRPRVVDDDDWIGMGRVDYQLQEKRGLANPAPATMARSAPGNKHALTFCASESPFQNILVSSAKAEEKIR